MLDGAFQSPESPVLPPRSSCAAGRSRGLTKTFLKEILWSPTAFPGLEFVPTRWELRDYKPLEGRQREVFVQVSVGSTQEDEMSGSNAPPWTDTRWGLLCSHRELGELFGGSTILEAQPETGFMGKRDGNAG